MGKIKRVVLTGVMTALIIAVPASSAFAWHCFVVNRSEKGTVNAGKSGNWFVLNIGEILQDEFGIDAELAGQIVTALDAEGVPTVVALNEKQLLAARSPHMWAGGYGDGKGIDSYFVGPYFETLVQVLADFGIELPEEDEH